MVMKRGSTIILRGAIILIGLIVLGLCIFALPAGIRSDSTGYYQPILLGLYVPAMPFFFALYQSLKLLDYIDSNKAFTQLSVNAFKYIKLCAMTIGALFTLGMPYIFQAADIDDAPGVVALGLVIVGASFVIATFSAVLQTLVQNAIDIKSENDLTV
jgi:hypothetical protein